MKLTRGNNGKARKELTPGEHRALVLETEEGESRAGNPKIVIKFEVGDVKKWIWYHVATNQGMRINELIDALGEDTDLYEGKECLVEVIEDTWNGKTSLKIDHVRPLSTGGKTYDDDEIPF